MPAFGLREAGRALADAPRQGCVDNHEITMQTFLMLLGGIGHHERPDLGHPALVG